MEQFAAALVEADAVPTASVATCAGFALRFPWGSLCSI